MQLTQAYLLAFAASVAAHGKFADVPACAQSCVSSLPAQCAMDPACICKDSTFISTVSCCVKSACSPAQEESTFRYASQLCGYFNATVTQPGPKSCAKNTTHTSSAGPKKTKVAQRDFGA